MQTRRQSAIETFWDTLISLGLGIGGNMILLPLTRHLDTVVQAVILTVVFIILSYCRKYSTRRYFNSRWSRPTVITCPECGTSYVRNIAQIIRQDNERIRNSPPQAM